MRENAEAALLRHKKMDILRAHYPEFVPFLRDMMDELGFSTSEIQEDIGLYMQYGPAYLMVQAQRGQAKTTITAIFAIWCLIHDPKFRVLIVSAGDRQASEISTLIVKLIMNVDVLEAMRPDRSNGDRTSTDAFDLHYSIKGVDKSPSVASMGVTSNLQGARADLLIADDVESMKNSRTAIQREQLMQITRDFTSINSTGRIVYLGTPQSIESIYNSLPARGFAVRIWPGRYPNSKQMEHYGDALAPIIRKRVEADPSLATGAGLDGEQGQAVDSLLLPEEALVKKELDQGAAFFMLQHMLLTALMDSLRFPLKTVNLISLRMDGRHFPMSIIRGFGSPKDWSVNGQKFQVSQPGSISADIGALQSSVFYIDPAGGGLNADETAYAHVGLLNSNLFLMEWGGIPGGYELPQMEHLADLIVASKPTVVKIEKNMGHGAFKAVFQPILTTAAVKAGIPVPGLADDFVTGQKETRIIATLEPIIGRGSLIINEAILENEAASVARYDVRLRTVYSGLFQLAKLTRDKNSLIHDDRIDALEGACRHYADALSVDQKKAIEAAKKREYERMNKNPLNKPSYAMQATRPQNSLQKRIRTL